MFCSTYSTAELSEGNFPIQNLTQELRNNFANDFRIAKTSGLMFFAHVAVSYFRSRFLDFPY